MPHRAAYPVVLLALVLLAGCEDPADPARRAPVELEPSLDVLPPQPPAGRDFYLWPVTIARGTGTQTVQIPLADRPWLDFMEPFDLYIVKDADSLLGSVALDGVVKLLLSKAGAQDTVVRRVTLTPSSQLEVVLRGRNPGAVTLWIVGRLQPRPTVTFDFPQRAAMVDSAGNIESIPLRGMACHTHFPITELRVVNTTIPVTGTNLCEPFEVAHASRLGGHYFWIDVTNARGRTTRHVQTYLRAGDWQPSIPEEGVVQALINAEALVLNPLALDDGNRGTVNDFATLVRAAARPATIDPWFPAVIAGAEPTQPRCDLTRIVTRRGYRIDRGTTSFDDMTVALQAVAGGVRIDVGMHDVAVPVTVHGWLKRSCEEPQHGVTGGVVTIPVATSLENAQLSLSGGELHLTDVLPTVMAAPPSLDIEFGHRSMLTSAQQSEIIDILAAYPRADVIDGMPHLGLAVSAALRPLLTGLGPAPGPGLAELGVVVNDRFASVAASTQGIGMSWYLDMRADSMRTGAPPARGPVWFLSTPPDLSDLPSPAIGAVSIDAMNALLWTAWVRGEFDAVDLVDHPAAPDVAGLRVRLRSLLPPIVQWGIVDSRQFRFLWGDMRLDLVANRRVWGDAPVRVEQATGRGYATIAIDVLFDYDAVTRQLEFEIVPLHSAVLVQMPTTMSAWIDETAVHDAIEDVIWAVAPELLARVIGELPVPAATPLAIPSLAPRSSFRLITTSTTRNGNYAVLGGIFQAE